MKVSLPWINKYVDLSDVKVEQLADRLTFAGVEVEEIIKPIDGSNLVIGKIISCIPHPDSDHLHVLKVDLGKELGIADIVCGAPNAKEGLKVIVALPGAKLPGGEIKPTQIRGVQSNGMCCSLLELGVDKKFLSPKQLEGIEELPNDAEIGNKDVLSYLGLDGTILDISVLPNRPDLYSIENVALEIAALLGKKAHLEEPSALKTVDTDFKVSSLTPNCPMFGARVVKGVHNGPSPSWLVSLLRQEGIRSISKVVDIGNYIMLLTGQPLNMYDLDKLPENNLVVIDDYEGDFKAMDGNSYHLIKGDLLVSSGGKGMCLAGVMTADSCRIDEKSQNIVIEAASFSGASIRHTSSRLGLVSDSSLRFVKGVNPHQVEKVLSLTCDILEELCSPKEISKTVLYDQVDHSPKEVEVSLSYINERLATSFSLKQVVDALQGEDFKVKAEGEKLKVTIPHRRLDIEGKADISEEVIRLLGFENIPSQLPSMISPLAGLTSSQSQVRSIRTYLRSIGINEALTYTLISKKQSKEFAYINTNEAYVISNPMSEDHCIVRPNLAYSLLNIASYNASRQIDSIAFFEVSDIDSINYQGKHLGIVLAGKKPIQGKIGQRNYSYYDVKGILEGIIGLLSIKPSRIQIAPLNSDKNEFHPRRSALVKLDGKVIAVLGEVHPQVNEEYGLDYAVIMEIDLNALLEIKSGAIKSIIPPKYPSIRRDISFVIDENAIYEDIKKAVWKSSALISNVEVFDVYKGTGLKEGSKSIALAITFSSPERTLTDEEVDAAFAKMNETLLTKFHAEVRS